MRDRPPICHRCAAGRHDLCTGIRQIWTGPPWTMSTADCECDCKGDRLW